MPSRLLTYFVQNLLLWSLVVASLDKNYSAPEFETVFSGRLWQLGEMFPDLHLLSIHAQTSEIGSEETTDWIHGHITAYVPSSNTVIRTENYASAGGGTTEWSNPFKLPLRHLDPGILWTWRNRAFNLVDVFSILDAWGYRYSWTQFTIKIVAGFPLPEKELVYHWGTNSLATTDTLFVGARNGQVWDSERAASGARPQNSTAGAANWTNIPGSR